MTTRKFYKQRFTLVVLSEEPIPHEASIVEIVHEAIEGGYSASDDRGPCVEINGRQAAKALMAQGSVPEFFEIDLKGNDLD